MTQEQNDKLYNALDSLYQTKEFRELKELVMELSQKEECVKGNYNNIYPSIERHIDLMAETAGWIYDTLNGTPKRGLSKCQKIRKALGYTYP